jgi:hypothetical protein
MRLGILFPSTCVGLRYGRQNFSLEVFLGSMESPTFSPKASTSRLRVNGTTDLPIVPSYTLEPPLPIGGWVILLRHPIVITMLWRYRNVDLLSIDYAFRPRLRDRLTLSGLTFLRKP